MYWGASSAFAFSGLALFFLTVIVLVISISIKVLKHSDTKFALKYLGYLSGVMFVIIGITVRVNDGLHNNYSDRGLMIMFGGLSLLIIMLLLQFLRIMLYWKEDN